MKSIEDLLEIHPTFRWSEKAYGLLWIDIVYVSVDSSLGFVPRMALVTRE